MFLEESLERLVHRRAKPLLDERAADMRTARGAAVGELKDGFRLERDVQLIESRDHFINALLADVMEPRHLNLQRGIRQLQLEAEQVDLVPVKIRCQFGPRNKLQSLRATRLGQDRRYRSRGDALPFRLAGVCARQLRRFSAP